MRRVRAREINLRRWRVMGAVVEPDFRWWWIGRVRNRGPAGAAGKLAAGVGRDRGRCDGQCVGALLV